MKKGFVSIILIALLTLSVFAGCSSEKSITPASGDLSSTEEITESSASSISITSSNIEFSDMEMAYKQALKDAEIATEKDAETAIEWLKNNINNIYDSNDMMEKAAYYGTLIKQIYPNSGDTVHEIGYETLTCVKYVYHGYNKVEDSLIQRRYNKIKEMLKSV